MEIARPFRFQAVLEAVVEDDAVIQVHQVLLEWRAQFCRVLALPCSDFINFCACAWNWIDLIGQFD